MRIKKLAAFLAAAVMAATSMGSTAFVANAAEVSGHTNTSKLGKLDSFDDDWEKKIYFTLSVDGQASKVSAKVGFDTWCQDEDYIKSVWAPTGWRHRGRVENGSCKNVYTEWTRGGENSDKSDIKHTTKYVDYWVYVKV